MWASLKEAGIILNINPSNICQCLSGKTLFSGGFGWVYVENYNINNIKKVKFEKCMVKVNQIDIETGNVIKIWNSMSEAARYLSTINGSNWHSIASKISACAKNKQNTCHGYKWKYNN
jgi:hypothetical protein